MLFDGADQLHAGNKGGEPVQRVRKAGGIELAASALQVLRMKIAGAKGGRDLPAVFHSGVVEPIDQRLFGVGFLERRDGLRRNRG